MPYVTAGIIGIWAPPLAYATAAAYHPAVDPLPSPLRAYLMAALVAGTLVVVTWSLFRRLRRDLLTAWGLQIAIPRRDNSGPVAIDPDVLAAMNRIEQRLRRDAS